jgi:hypothetical protein
VAQKVQVVLVDDIDGAPGDQTVTFAYNGVAYEIDLSNENADRFADLLAPYIGHARRVGGSGRRAGRRTTGGPSPSVIREWAKTQGIEVNERGRISAELRSKYDAAH